MSATGPTGPAGPRLVARYAESAEPTRVFPDPFLYRHRKAVVGGLLGFGVAVLFIACLVATAFGDPGGWAPWRVLLCSLWAVPIGVLIGVAMGESS